MRSFHRTCRAAPPLLALVAVPLLVGPAAAAEPDRQAQIEEALSAAPPAIRATAKVMDEKGNVLKEGTGPYTCFPTPEAMRATGSSPMCLDEVGMAWADAYTSKKPFKTDRVGVAYMLAGDAVGASNADPYAEAPSQQNQWVSEGPSLMIFVSDPAQLAGLPTTPWAEGPYVMWPGTPYAHLMVPVGPRPAQRPAGR
jgi:hypothetical protein